MEIKRWNAKVRSYPETTSIDTEAQYDSSREDNSKATETTKATTCIQTDPPIVSAKVVSIRYHEVYYSSRK